MLLGFGHINTMFVRGFLIAIALLVVSVIATTEKNPRPNIIFILADDLGWNDVGFHGSNQVPTPNIDALAYSGVILNNYYVLPICTPSRSALMTGKHPTHTGMHLGTIHSNEPYGLPLKEKLLPEFLKEQGYKNHLIGKWHLGYFKKEYTPLYRGFDTHFGYWTGREDYFNHVSDSGSDWGYDLRRGMNVSWDSKGKYATTLFTEESVKIIREHNTTEPLFLCLAHLATHSANHRDPLQAPEEVIQMFNYIKDEKRRKFAAMLSLLDKSVGDVVKALSEKSILDNSIIIFSSDNGGPAGGFNDNIASNWPLRGVKDTVWQGGVQSAAFIWSPLIANTPRVSQQMMHIQDWLPTLMSAIGASEAAANVTLGIDGRDVWSAINDPDKDTYDELLLVIDDHRKLSALIKNVDNQTWKISEGTIGDGKFDKIIGPHGRGDYKYDWSALTTGMTAQIIKKSKCALPSMETMKELRKDSQIICQLQDLKDTKRICHPSKGEVCLFNLNNDPCEQINLANEQKDIKNNLLKLLAKHKKTVVPAVKKSADPVANPKCWDHVWINWKDYPVPEKCVIKKKRGLEI